MKKELKKRSIASATDSEIKANLISWYNEASLQTRKEGKSWYNDARRFAQKLSKELDIDLYRCAAVISTLSPNNKWKRNKIDAKAVIVAFTAGLGPESVKVCTYNSNKEKAFRILKGELISEKSPKTHAFAMNIASLSSDHITVDKWHIRACLTKPIEGILPTVEGVTIKQYRRIERLTSEVSKGFKIHGFQFQAIVWIQIKNSWDRNY